MRHPTLAALGCFVAFGLLLAPGHNSFETPAPESLVALGKTGHLGLPDNPGGVYVLGTDGRAYSTHEPGAYAVGIPAVAVARALSRVARLPLEKAIPLVLSLLCVPLFAAGLLAALGFVRAAAGEGADLSRGALWAVLSTPMLLYGLYPSDVSLSALVLLGLLPLTFLHGERRWAPLAWGAALGFAVLLKVSNATLGLAAGVALLLRPGVDARRKFGDIALLGAGALPSLVALLAWNALRTGHPLHFPYPEDHAFALDRLPEGLVGTFASPGRGLLLFAPVLPVLAAGLRWSRVSPQVRALLAVLAGSFALTVLRLAGTPAWTGSGGWAIRYYVPWLGPLAVVLYVAWHQSGRRWARAVAVASALGLLVNGAGLLTNYHYRQGLCGMEPWPPRSALSCAVSALPANVARTLGAPVPEVVLEGASPANVFASNRLATWWMAARAYGVPPAASFAVGALLLACGLWLARRAFGSGADRSQARRQPS